VQHEDGEVEEKEKPETRRGTDIIIIQPGSQSLQLGLACDAQPRFIAHAVARRMKIYTPGGEFYEGPREDDDKAARDALLDESRR
jgi:hypothetical protein